MRLLFVMAQAYFPRQADGMQVVTRDLAHALRARFHLPTIAAEMSLRGLPGLASGMRALSTRSRLAHETYEGIPVLRARAIGRRIPAILDAARPHCVILQSMGALDIAHDIAAAGIPLVVCWHDADLHRLAGTPVGLNARFVANSRFTAGVYEAEFGITSAVIPPIIRPENYAAPRPQGERGQITFIDPVPEKGVDIALAVAAACRDIPFEFVESRILPAAQRRALAGRVAALPNVRLSGHVTDMRPIYARTRILLAPSQRREGWGRAASEAQVNGIPVVASRIGGLPEAVGPGGILLPPDAPMTHWTAAVDNLWRNEDAWAHLSERAHIHAARADIAPDTIVDRMLDEIEAAMPPAKPRPPGAYHAGRPGGSAPWTPAGD